MAVMRAMGPWPDLPLPGSAAVAHIQFGYRLWAPSDEEINVKYWEILNCPLAECLDQWRPNQVHGSASEHHL